VGDKPRTRSVRPLVVVSDLHVGCGLAVMPPGGFTDDEGNHRNPGRLQRKLGAWWDEFWKWVEVETQGDYDVCVNGDLIDGMHHENTTHWTANMDTQRQACVQLLRPVRERAQRFLVVRGTETHTGKSGQHEEAIARELNAEKSREGTCSHWELYYRMGRYLVHLTHHIGTTSSPFAESGALNREMVSGYVQSGRSGKTAPDVYVRSHRHTCAVFSHPSERDDDPIRMSTSISTPSWQLKTPYLHRTAARMQQPQIGGVLIIAGHNTVYAKPWTRFIERPGEV